MALFAYLLAYLAGCVPFVFISLCAVLSVSHACMHLSHLLSLYHCLS